MLFLPGMSLSGPFLLEISVKSLRILAAFLASDLMLDGIGLLTADTHTHTLHTHTHTLHTHTHYTVVILAHS